MESEINLRRDMFNYTFFLAGLGAKGHNFSVEHSWLPELVAKYSPNDPKSTSVGLVYWSCDPVDQVFSEICVV